MFSTPRSDFSPSQIALTDEDVAVVFEEAMTKKQCLGLELRKDGEVVKKDLRRLIFVPTKQEERLSGVHHKN